MTRSGLPTATVSQWLLQRAAATPQAAAYHQRSVDGRWLSLDWASFADQAAGLRRGLAAAGLRRGDRLALIAPVSVHWELLHHAALSMGVTLIGLDTHDLPARVADMAAQAGVQAFAVQSPASLSGLSPVQRAQLRLLVTLGEPADDATWPDAQRRLSLDGLRQLGQHPAADPEPAQPDDIATVIFTSGTTGAPKGIAYSHAQLCLAIEAILDAFGHVHPDGRLLCWLPLSNLFQRIVNLVGMRHGVGTWLLDDPRQVMAVVAEVGPDIFIGVPRFFEKLHEGLMQRINQLPAPARALTQAAWRLGRHASRQRRLGRRLPMPWRVMHRVADALVLRRVRAVMGPRLQAMVSGSAPMPLALLEDFDALGWTVLEAYGLSENVLPMAMNRLDAHRLGTVGRPMAGNEIEIEADGMVRVRGPGVFSGYLGDAPHAHGAGQSFYSTGDLAELDADGFLRLTGRLGDLIKTSTGRRVAPAGVEAALRGVPGVDQVVVVGQGRKLLLAICTVVPGHLAAAPIQALKTGLQAAVTGLNPHERPAGIVLSGRPFSIDAGELTPNLKLRRQAIALRHARLLDQLDRQLDPPGEAGRLQWLLAPDGPA